MLLAGMKLTLTAEDLTMAMGGKFNAGFDYQTETFSVEILVTIPPLLVNANPCCCRSEPDCCLFCTFRPRVPPSSATNPTHCAGPTSHAAQADLSKKSGSAAFATDIPVEAVPLKAAVQLGYGSGEKAVINALAGLSYDAKDFSLAVKNSANADCMLINTTFLGLYKHSSAFTVAFALDTNSHKAGKKAWDAFEVDDKAKKTITVGCEYK